MKKSSVDEIRRRFDGDVERFSNLTTGQDAAIDSALSMELIAEAAIAATPQAQRVLDLGCGAGNYSLKLLQYRSPLDVTLVDLSQPMLTRARQRVSAATSGTVTTCQSDLRDLDFAPGSFDVILAAAVLHHLRTPNQWQQVFENCCVWLKPNGGFWIFDLVECSHPAVQSLMWARYGEYLRQMRGPEYRDQVFAYIHQEDTPRTLTDQLQLLQRVGFGQVEVLHKNGCFAAFGGIKHQREGVGPQVTGP